MEETKRRRFIIRAVLEGEVDVQEEPQPQEVILFEGANKWIRNLTETEAGLVAQSVRGDWNHYLLWYGDQSFFVQYQDVKGKTLKIKYSLDQEEDASCRLIFNFVLATDTTANNLNSRVKWRDITVDSNGSVSDELSFTIDDSLFTSGSGTITDDLWVRGAVYVYRSSDVVTISQYDFVIEG